MDDVLRSDRGPSAVPFWERPLWRGALTLAVVLLILLGLWLVFPSEYWRF